MNFTLKWAVNSWLDLHPVCVWRSQSETSPCGTSSGCSPACLWGGRHSKSSFFTHLLPSFLSLSGSDLDGIVFTLTQHEDHRWQTCLSLSFPPVPSSLIPWTFKRWHHFSSAFLSCSCNCCDNRTLLLPSFPFHAFFAGPLFIFSHGPNSTSLPPLKYSSSVSDSCISFFLFFLRLYVQSFRILVFVSFIWVYLSM